jgi:hypothetical protein
MRISQIKICGLIYDLITGYDKAYRSLREKGILNLENDEHCNYILDFLRKWQCRQFKKDDKERTLNSIKEWLAKDNNRNVLDHFKNTDIFSVDIKLFDDFQNSFNDLVDSEACTRKNNTNFTKFGQVGVAKLLFAFKPEIFIPWDNEIIRHYKEHYGIFNYCTFIKKMIERLKTLESECERNGKSLESLKDEIEKSRQGLNKNNNEEVNFNLTYPKLIDEYNWVTITKKLNVDRAIEVFKGKNT